MTSFDKNAMSRYAEAFKRYVEDYAHGECFTTFDSCLYIKENEAYKDRVYALAQKAMNASKWKASDIGSGTILSEVSNALRERANLVNWNQFVRFENKAKENVAAAEDVLFSIYRGDNPGDAFETAREYFGGYYDLIAYLFFIKSKSRYLPICPGYFDAAFSNLGIDLKTSRRCSWDNYNEFIDVVRAVREVLGLLLEGSEPSLLDAHSFLWMNDVLTKYLETCVTAGPEFVIDVALEKNVDAVVKARVNQNVFRNRVIESWNGKCAVTGCSLTGVLIASHIKPWRDCCENNEWLNPYNGILLSPNIDKLFDRGLITFDDNGHIVFSSKLSASEAESLGITQECALRWVDERHKPFLAYHRSNVFQG